MNQENNYNQDNFSSQENNEKLNNQQVHNSQNINNNENVYQNTNINQNNNYQQQVKDNMVDKGNNKLKMLFESKPQLKKVMILLIAIVILVIVLIAVISLMGGKIDASKNEVYPLETTSYFEKVNNLYALKNEDGDVLLENIEDYGYFCNGTTRIKNEDGAVAIIDDEGNFIAEYGRYKYIDHEGCFYEVTDTSNGYQKILLKSDGSVLYKNDDDLLLKDIMIKERGYFLFGDLLGSMGYTMLEQEEDEEYILYSANGNILLKLDIMDDVDYPEFNDQNIYMYNEGKYTETDNTKYLALYYNYKTYLFNLVTEKLTFTLDGKYVFDEINKGNDNQYILKCKSGNCENPMIVVNDDKISYETDCESLRFVDDQGKLCCHDYDATMHNFYNINGKFIETVKSEKNGVVYSTTDSSSTTYELTTSGKIVLILLVIAIVGVVIFILKKKKNKEGQSGFNSFDNNKINNNSNLDVVSNDQVNNTSVEQQSIIQMNNSQQIISSDNNYIQKDVTVNKKFPLKWILIIVMTLIIVVVLVMLSTLKNDNKNVEVLSFQCSGDDFITTYYFEDDQMSRVIYTVSFRSENEAINYYDITVNDPFERFMNVKRNDKVVTYELIQETVQSGYVNAGKDKEYFLENESECLIKDFVPDID